MTPKNKYLYIARVTLQTATPLSIGSGVEDARFDSPVVRDANGLPALPATSIAGVLRHGFDTTMADALFGYTDGDEGDFSRVTVSWGHIHDSKNCPLDGLDFVGMCQEDPILSRLKGELPLRDHVCLTHRGAAADKGKFDRSFVPRGCRFTFELALWCENEDAIVWKDLLQRISSADFRLGGSTRRGYGGLKVEKLMTAQFNLAFKESYESYSKLPRSLDKCDGLADISASLNKQDSWLYADITLQPEDFWRFGGGANPLVPGKAADMLPYTEQEITWDKDDKGTWSEKLKVVIPASAIKGALAHRVAFHANRRANFFSDDPKFTPGWDKSEECEVKVVLDLFGYANDHENGKSTGKTGVLWLDDVYLDLDGVTPARLMHNSVDRFTGGVRDGALFSEEALYGGEIKLRLCFTKQAEVVRKAVREALNDALGDLYEGRLALGASGTKGLGYCTGKSIWNDGGIWLKGGE